MQEVPDMVFPKSPQPVAVALAAMLAPALAACATPGAGPSSPDGEARLAQMLEGRSAGEPRSCIPVTVSNRLQIIDQTAIVYDAGNTIYVARPERPGSLRDEDILVVERYGGQLCKHDVIRTLDRSFGFTTGIIFLGDFVPYRKD